MRLVPGVALASTDEALALRRWANVLAVLCEVAGKATCVSIIASQLAMWQCSEQQAWNVDSWCSLAQLQRGASMLSSHGQAATQIRHATHALLACTLTV